MVSGFLPQEIKYLLNWTDTKEIINKIKITIKILQVKVRLFLCIIFLIISNKNCAPMPEKINTTGSAPMHLKEWGMPS